MNIRHFTPALVLLSSLAMADDGMNNFLAGTPLAPLAERQTSLKFKFKIPYQTVKEYYSSLNIDYIVENQNEVPMLDLSLKKMNNSWDNIPFLVNLKKKNFFTRSLINPHSLSQLFVTDPVAYIQHQGGEDFLTAKQIQYAQKKFNLKTYSYEKDFIQMEDWRSLNHPPVQDLGEDLSIWDKTYSPEKVSEKHPTFHNPEFHKQIDTLSETELSFGNKVELLENGDSYRRKIAEIENARSSVLVAVMSFFCDSTSKDLEQTLIRKAKEGVDIKLMVEKVWTKIAMMKCLNRMIDGGVDVVLANDLLKPGEKKALFHDKFMIIDSKIVIMGGANIISGDNVSTGDNHLNRDNDVFIEGPIATDATLAFTKLWKGFETKKNIKNQKDPRVKPIEHYEELAKNNLEQERQQGLRGANRYAEILGNEESRDNGVCRFLNQSPQTDKHKLSKVFIEHIKAAKSKLNMTNGSSFYFDLPSHKEKERARETWNKQLYEHIFDATERGVKLDIVGNHIDGGYGEASSIFHYMFLKNRKNQLSIKMAIGSLLAGSMDKMVAKKNQPYIEHMMRKNNIRVWTHFQYMHAKKTQIDHVLSWVSSYNLEEWSADKSHESGVICMDKNLNLQMQRSFLKDVVNSVPAYDTQADKK